MTPPVLQLAQTVNDFNLDFSLFISLLFYMQSIMNSINLNSLEFPISSHVSFVAILTQVTVASFLFGKSLLISLPILHFTASQHSPQVARTIDLSKIHVYVCLHWNMLIHGIPSIFYMISKSLRSSPYILLNTLETLIMLKYIQSHKNTALSYLDLCPYNFLCLGHSTSSLTYPSNP